MPSITQLEYIIAVSKHRHFGRAAIECHVSQPSLSAQIQKVEEDLGFIIFDRSKKPILVTDLGKKLVAQAKIVLQEYTRLIDVRQKEGGLSGDFHLGVIPTLSPYLVPLFIETFSKNHPDVRLKISEYQTADIINKLYDDEIDGGLLVTPLKDDKIIERALFLEPFYIFASDSHPLLKKKIVKEVDLDENDIWLLDEGHCFRDQVIRFCSLGRNSHVLKNISFSSGSLETLINLIRKGTGYTLLPFLATSHLTKDEIKSNLRPFLKPVPTREVSLVHSRSFLKEDIIHVLIEDILKNIPRQLINLKSGQARVIEI
jgi:LysR family hydrogen peroxide-inducible transcriptional activator